MLLQNPLFLVRGWLCAETRVFLGLPEVCGLFATRCPGPVAGAYCHSAPETEILFTECFANREPARISLPGEEAWLQTWAVFRSCADLCGGAASAVCDGRERNLEDIGGGVEQPGNGYVLRRLLELCPFPAQDIPRGALPLLKGSTSVPCCPRRCYEESCGAERVPG